MSTRAPYYPQQNFDVDDMGLDDKAIIEHHHHHHTVGSDHVWTAKAPAKTAKAIICRLLLSIYASSVVAMCGKCRNRSCLVVFDLMPDCRCCGHVVKLNFSIEDLVESQKRAAEQNTMLKMKLIEIQKQVKVFQEQGHQLARVIDQCKAQKEAIQTLEAQVASDQTRFKEEVRKVEALAASIGTLKAQHEEALQKQAKETEALRARLADAADEVQRLCTAEDGLRAELEAARRVTPPSEQMVRENAALRQRVKTLEEVYCPYG